MASTIETTEDIIHNYRVERFVELGFEEDDASLLAVAKGDNGFPVDTHYAKRLLAAGCPHKLAVRILV